MADHTGEIVRAEQVPEERTPKRWKKLMRDGVLLLVFSWLWFAVGSEPDLDLEWMAPWGYTGMWLGGLIAAYGLYRAWWDHW